MEHELAKECIAVSNSPAMATAPARPIVRAAAIAAICAFLAIAVAGVFGQTIWFEFVNLDDSAYVYNNTRVANGFTAEGISWAFTDSAHTGNWHPLTWLSLMLDSQIYGTSRPGGYHLTNILLHAANAILLFLLFQQMTGDFWPSAFVAGVFAIHPLHVESVAWVTERKDVLSGFFGLMSLWAYLWYTRRPNVGRYLAVATALALGLMAKPILVTWPFLFLLVDYWPLGRWQGAGSGRHGAGNGEHSAGLAWLILEKVPLILLVLAFAAIAFLAQRSGGSVVSLEKMPMLPRIARAIVLYVDYLGKSIWPTDLAVYGAEPPTTFLPVLASGLLLALLTAGALWGAYRGQRWLAVGWFWYLATMLPTIGLVQVGTQVKADRFMYLPQIGLCLALAWSAAYVFGRWTTRGADDRRFVIAWLGCASFALLVIVALAACAVRQTRYWRDSIALWTRAVDCAPSDPAIRVSFGAALIERGRLEDAIVQYQQAVSLKPDFVVAIDQLGSALGEYGALDAAIAQFQRALEIDPRFTASRANLGIALLRRQQTDEAIDQFQQVLSIAPQSAVAHCGLGTALVQKGKLDEAADQFRKAIAAAPDYVKAHNSLGVILLSAKKPDEAISHFQKVLQLKPGDAEASRNLELARAQKKGNLPTPLPLP
jgi:tetratricopeptide (TPR) repeat protein